MTWSSCSRVPAAADKFRVYLLTSSHCAVIKTLLAGVDKGGNKVLLQISALRIAYLLITK